MVASGAVAASSPRGERTEGVSAAQGGEGAAEAGRGCGVGHVGAGRWERTGDLADGGVPERRAACGAWLNQQRGPKEQADPFLQGALLGGRSRCWTVIKLVISLISLNKM